MKLSNSLGLLNDFLVAVRIAFVPTVRAILRKPSLLLHPILLSREFMSHVWVLFGEGVDTNTAQIKSSLLTPNCFGVVLDVGAGHGHSAKYLDRSKVTKYVALEPNENMHAKIRAAAAECGFTEAAGTLVVLPYGAEQTALITSALGGAQSVDTIVSILSFCGVPDPEDTIRALVQDVLAPHGQLLFYEHVRNPRPDVAWWQRFWTPVWKRAFDGCCLDRPTDVWMDKLGMWESKEIWTPENEPEEHLFWHRMGKLVKSA